MGKKPTWSSTAFDQCGRYGCQGPAHPAPFRAQAIALGHIPKQQSLLPPAAVESGASRGSVGAARLRCRPVTETLATLGQADAVVSASRDSRMTLSLARVQVAWALHLVPWLPPPQQVFSVYCVQAKGGRSLGEILISTPQSSESL